MSERYVVKWCTLHGEWEVVDTYKDHVMASSGNKAEVDEIVRRQNVADFEAEVF